MDSFHVCSISPGYLDHAGTALATARAGGVGILDLEGAPADRLSRCRANVRRQLEQTGPGVVVGVRLSASEVGPCADILGLLEGREHWLILSRWDAADLKRLAPELAAEGRRLWLELTRPDQAAAAAFDGTPEFAGWVARGSECGGTSGAAAAFYLTQHLARQPKPFLVQGGQGLQSAAACRVAGAAGVVFDDQLLLMPESPLPEEWKAILRKTGCEDTAGAGEDLGLGVRFGSRAELHASRELLGRAAELSAAADLSDGERRAAWRAALGERLGWGPPGQRAWPVGQGAGFASLYAERFRTTGRFVAAARRAADYESIARARDARPLSRHSALAQSHGTEFPVVQGPMTRVSDGAGFAAAVADAGALPMMALALLGREAAAALLAETERLLAGRPWGVGILGFVPQEVRAGQLAAIRERRPPFALIAGGRPDQAAQLEELGIATYLHAPAANILRLFLGQGARRFVFEGSECGGHTGPLTSFTLWQQAIEVLLSEVPAAEAEKVHVLFAGGIHDALSAAMVSAMAAPLAARGMRVGVLMGTAYLFTREVVESGAVVEEFQRAALECRQTTRLETGVGHAIRCAPTPFADEFKRTRAELLRRGVDRGAVFKSLDGLTLGRARVASKGLLKEGQGHLRRLDAPEQRERGMYMMGDVAALRASVTDAAGLHAEVSDAGVALLEECAAALRPEQDGAAAPAEVAIIGAACFVPGAQDLQTFWRRLLDKENAITEIPARRFDWRLYYDADPAAEDRIYSRWGGFLDEVEFDPVRFGIPPRSLKSISLSQLLALEASRRALDDAGYGSGDFDRENTAVIFGTSSTADLYHYYIARSALPVCAEGPQGEAFRRLPAWTEESFPGTLLNVTAGRVANRLDLGGPNYAMDAACASSLAALGAGVRELETGRSSMVLVAGVDLDQTPYAYLAFSKTRAFSPTGAARPFDRSADGIVISEGVVTLVLKRLADAERDGDRVYAVIKSIEGSSDGKGLGLTAPRPGGQRRALRRAYGRAGFSPASIGMYEAHGTGTAVGDRAELETIVSTLAGAGAPASSCVIGSAKSLLGHTKAAAGMVGLLKAALALYHRTLPPHAGVEQPLEPLTEPGCPVRLIDEPQPWLESSGPRRAGVSAFGFGGTNFHAVLEEYRGHLTAPPAGADAWPAELFTFAADSAAGLGEQLDTLRRALDAPGRLQPSDLAFTCAANAQASGGRARLAFVASGLPELRRQLASALEAVGGGAVPRGVYYSPDAGPAAPGGVAFLFPGQGAQYPGMGRELAVYLPEFRHALEEALRLLPARTGRAVRDAMLPSASFSAGEEEERRARLAATEVAQPALGVMAAGMLDLAARLGLRADYAAGHSYGEYAALHAAGVLDRAGLFALSDARGRAMARAADTAPGAMAAVHLSRLELEPLLDGLSGLTLANDNGPRQCVISGGLAAVDAAAASLEGSGVRVTRLRVGSAFHSPLMRPAADHLAHAIAAADIARPALPVYSNVDAAPYPDDADSIRRRLAAHLESPVEFAAQIRAMHAAGARVFVELGPKGTLVGLVANILEGEPYSAVSLDGHGGGLGGLLQSLAALFVNRVPFSPLSLFEGRAARRVEPGEAARATPRAEWLVDGGCVRRRDEQPGLVAEQPILTLETRREADDSRTPTPPPALPEDPTRDPVLDAYQEYQGTMRLFLEKQEQVLMQLLDRIEGRPDAPAPHARPAASREPHEAEAAKELSAPRYATPPPASAPPDETAPAADGAAPQEASAELTHEGVVSLLARLVSERTGYSPEMFDIDQDFEAELGVDSIKRIEILAGLESALPAALAETVRAQTERLMHVKTLRALADTILREWHAARAETPPPVPAESNNGAARSGNGNGAAAHDGRALSPDDTAAHPEPHEPDAGCPRFVLRGRPAAPPSASAPLPRGLFLLTEDTLGVGEELAGLLLRAGADAELIPRAALADREELRGRVERVMAERGAVRGVVHLAPLAPRAPEVGFGLWKREAEIQTKSLFELLQLSAAGRRPGEGPALVISATLFGGLWGRAGSGPDSSSGLAVAGGTHGILRSLAEESDGLTAKTVDLSPSMPPRDMAAALAAEIASADGAAEVGYTADGGRVVFGLESAPVVRRARPRRWKPEPSWVVLVTGGARGITSRCAREAAGPGVRMIVVGSGPLGDDPEEDASPEAAALLRERFVAEARASGARPVPAALDERVRRALRDRERNANLRELRARGAEAEYHQVDVRSEAAFGGLIEDTYARFGRIDGVIHGAGVIEDKLLPSKTRDSFDRVFDTKADSVYVLRRALRPEGLKWVVLFSSVAARVGNRGQVDYAAANEVLNRAAWEMARGWPATRVVAINWGPWAGGGMVTEGVRRVLAGRGFRPIDAEAGARFFVEELAWGGRDEVEVIAGQGPWSARPAATPGPPEAARLPHREFEGALEVSGAGD